MRKILSAFLCILMCVYFSPAAFAAGPGAPEDIGPKTNHASELKELGLFKGVEKDEGTVDFDLGREPDRAEALILLVRALGKGPEAEVHPKTHPFTDVPSWADGYVSYAYENGLTKGESDTLFGTENPVSAEMYLTYMLRALGYSDGERKEFTWDMPWALAAWCGILPTQINKTRFLWADAVDVTCAALFANIKGTDTKLYERLESQGAFTAERFKAVFPQDPFADFRRIDGQVRAAIAGQYKLGKVEDNVYAAECHYMTEINSSDDVLKLSVLVCFGQYTLYKNGYLNGGSSVAPWLVELDPDNFQLKSCRPAYELKNEGFELTDCFSNETLEALDLLRMPMRSVCQMEVQVKIDSGEFKFRQPTYEEALAKATASLSEITKTAEAEPCTIMLGKVAGKTYYGLYIVYKPGSAVGEGETVTINSYFEGIFWLSPDGMTMYYSYHFVNRMISEALSPGGQHSLPESGIFTYTIELNSPNRMWKIRPD